MEIPFEVHVYSAHRTPEQARDFSLNARANGYGALIAAATKAGAIMGGADDETVNALYEYGRMIGTAFQIQDDYLDVISDEKDLGKPVGSDIAKGKMTLMVVKALAESEGEDHDRLLEILKAENNSQDEIDEVRNIVISEMQNVVHLTVPLIADCGVGANWLAAH